MGRSPQIALFATGSTRPGDSAPCQKNLLSPAIPVKICRRSARRDPADTDHGHSIVNTRSRVPDPRGGPDRGSANRQGACDERPGNGPTCCGVGGLMPGAAARLPMVHVPRQRLGGATPRRAHDILHLPGRDLPAGPGRLRQRATVCMLGSLVVGLLATWLGILVGRSIGSAGRRAGSRRPRHSARRRCRDKRIRPLLSPPIHSALDEAAGSVAGWA